MTMRKEHQRAALKYIQERGVSLDDTVTVVEEMIHDTVRSIEKQIHKARSGRKELEYKKWYPYNIDADYMVAIENEIVRCFFCDDECDPSSDEYKEKCRSVAPIITIVLDEVKQTHEVSIEIEGREPDQMVVHYQQELERFYQKYVFGTSYGFGCWLVPVEEDGSERKRWLQESLFETIGRGVKVTKAIAAIDDPDVHEITDWLNSDEGKPTLKAMKKWQNGAATIMRTKSRREVYVYKTKDIALVHNR
ncbi:MAG: hypothetical protein ACFFE6_01865 [Candidatus Thorarchaeota archaeon]